MAEPSVKGSIFRGVLDDLARVREEGRLSAEANPASWYPMESYARITQLLGDVEGAGKDSYFVERGRASARRLIKAGLYQQLAFLPRWNERTRRGAGEESASAYSEPMRLAIEGFFNECAHAAREDLVQLYTSERPAPDLILFRMTRDIADMFKRE